MQITNSLFVYGTLMFPEVQIALLGKKWNIRDAFLHGYETVTISYGNRISDYPVLRESEDSTVEGLLLVPISSHNRKVIDFYEGSEFTLKRFHIVSDGDVIPAMAYAHKHSGSFEYGPIWDREVFEKNHLQQYINQIIPGVLEELKSEQYY